MDPNQNHNGGRDMGYPPQGPPGHGYYGYPPQAPQMPFYGMPKRPQEPYGYRAAGPAGSGHYPAMPGFTKIYLGQLPLQITKEDIEEVFHEYCELGELKYVWPYPGS